MDVQNKILAEDILGKRNITVRTRCVFCNNHRETALHMFVHCSYIKAIWDLIKSCFSVKGKPSPLRSWWTVWRK